MQVGKFWECELILLPIHQLAPDYPVRTLFCDFSTFGCAGNATREKRGHSYTRRIFGESGKDYIPDCEDGNVPYPTIPGKREWKVSLITYPVTSNKNVPFRSRNQVGSRGSAPP